MRHPAFDGEVSREALIAWYRTNRERTKILFDCISPDAYFSRPIPLRNPIVFYEGHIPAFSVNTLAKLALQRPGIDEGYETLFARGIDPEDASAAQSPTDAWPSRKCVQEYGASADALMLQILEHDTLERDDVAELRNGEAAFTILEHELMHQETLLYLFHNLPHSAKRDPFPVRPLPQGSSASARRIAIPAGRATLGLERGIYGWDNEFPAHAVDVEAFAIDEHNVTNGQYLDYMNATGAAAPHFWTRGEDGAWLRRGLFETTPLPLDAAVYVTHDEAAAFARWRGGRLPSEAEYHRAAFGTPDGDERLFPWGEEPPDATRGNFDAAHWDPVDVGSYPQGASAWGVHDLVGNGWEWTSTLFDGFEGFTPMPSYLPYSTDFFDGAHYVMKGASPVTPRLLLRRSFRNWFRPNYPYVFATFRCAY